MPATRARAYPSPGTSLDDAFASYGPASRAPYSNVIPLPSRVRSAIAAFIAPKEDPTLSMLMRFGPQGRGSGARQGGAEGEHLSHVSSSHEHPGRTFQALERVLPG